MIKNKRIIWIILTLAAILAIIACAINPVSGKKELMLFSEKQEIAMGQESDQQIREQFGIYESKELNEYVNSVGQRMVPYSHRPNLKYHFAILDTSVVNAFAAPGGYIYLTRGIMALMGSEAEMAAVLGHEMGHVAARHSMKQLSGQMLAQIGLVVGSVLSKDIRKFSGLAGIGMQLLFLKFSRSDEYQADSLGIGYARQAQYAPGEMLRFFTALENMTAESGGQNIPTFLSTHPMTSDRIAKIKELISSQDVRLAVKRDPYLHRVDGIIYGENPRQGFTENGVFYQPEMAFKFTIPNGWAVENTPKQVVAGEKEGKAALMLQAVNSTQDLDTYMQTRAKEFGQAELLRQSSEMVNRFNSRHAYFRVPQEQSEPLAVRLTCIRKGGMIYSFLALSSYNDFNIYQNEFANSIESFQELDDPRYLNRKPNHLGLVRANGTQTLQAIFSSAGVDRKMWKQLGVFNSFSLESVPDSQQLIKIIQ